MLEEGDRRMEWETAPFQLLDGIVIHKSLNKVN